jgi:hypothetical protein
VWWWLVPVVVLGVLLLLLGTVVFLGRFRRGALLRPVIGWLSRYGFARRSMERMSKAALERQNPELASALRKIDQVGANPNPQAMQKAMSRMTAAERRAYLDAAQEQGGIPETANRQMRRQAERLQGGSRPPQARRKRRR